MLHRWLAKEQFLNSNCVAPTTNNFFFLIYTIQMSLGYTSSAAWLSVGMVENLQQAMCVLGKSSVKIKVYKFYAWAFYMSAGSSCRMNCPACLAYSLSRTLSLCHLVALTFSISLLSWKRYKSLTITHVACLTERRKIVCPATLQRDSVSLILPLISGQVTFLLSQWQKFHSLS